MTVDRKEYKEERGSMEHENNIRQTTRRCCWQRVKQDMNTVQRREEDRRRERDSLRHVSLFWTHFSKLSSLRLSRKGKALAGRDWIWLRLRSSSLNLGMGTNASEGTEDNEFQERSASTRFDKGWKASLSIRVRPTVWINGCKNGKQCEHFFAIHWREIVNANEDQVGRRIYRCW
jgi:hypothetical protein